MKDFVILAQQELMSKDEIKGMINSNINFSFSRINLGNKIVFPRYGVLPFYQELERDLEYQNSVLINNYDQHKYISNFEYYHDIEKYTPKTYFNFAEVPENKKLIVRGETNSKKFQWNTQMFADNKKDALKIMFDLQNDYYLQNQRILFREYVDLEVLEYGINGLPFANEWRFFYYQNQLIDYGYYWSISEKKPEFDPKALQMANKIAFILSEKINFFAIDVAKTKNGEWIVIEVNDGSMSGLVDIPKEKFYSNLKDAWYKNTKILF